jgi:O-antigen ligase
MLHAGMKQKAEWLRVLYISAFALALFGLFLSFSRAAWIAGGLVIIGLFFLYPHFMVRFSLISIPVVALLLASAPFTGLAAWAGERLYSEEAQESALSRLPVYQASFEMLVARPVLGWGYENFNEYDWQFYRRVGDFVNPDKNRSSHNFYLTLLAEQGLIGFFLFMIPFFACITQTLKILRKPPREKWDHRLLAVLWLFIMAYIIINSFQSMRIVFCLGLWWITLALMDNIVEGHVRIDEPEQPVVQLVRAYRVKGLMGRDEAIR